MRLIPIVTPALPAFQTERDRLFAGRTLHEAGEEPINVIFALCREWLDTASDEMLAGKHGVTGLQCLPYLVNMLKNLEAGVAGLVTEYEQSAGLRKSRPDSTLPDQAFTDHPDLNGENP